MSGRCPSHNFIGIFECVSDIVIQPSTGRKLFVSYSASSHLLQVQYKIEPFIMAKRTLGGYWGKLDHQHHVFLLILGLLILLGSLCLLLRLFLFLAFAF